MKISLVVPVFNEEETIPIFYEEVRNNEFLSKKNVEIIFINDGSVDSTEKIIVELVNKDKDVVLINFSRNFGKEPALFSGLENATGDVIIPIDVDLQDPIHLIEKMYYRMEEGYDVVLAKRNDRSSDNFLKRKTAELFYKTHNFISEVKIEPNVGDFRLMKRSVVNSIIELPETQLFMKGVLSWVGFRVSIISYKREERVAGNTKFNGWKLWNLAVEGITSFSTVPLKVWTYLGMIISSASFLYAIKLIFSKVIFGNPVAGYPSIMVTVLFLGGVQLIGIGVLGEYLGRVYMESKHRPKFIISEIVKSLDKKSE
ncbi:glycosyltransferase family 2 protein [Vibrio kanaloae]|uniref:glycosyltransferase family 2 protein n=1 Tax=Vibrio kanaloae TaxID=170673 RepID=UPI0010BE9E22|nr:glycosyltransferase family 2 protein [Vibrio kanaloae]TKF02069.1 glycosyltransferase family 2 protein [Vibrio kanaloae]TKF19155.1 glycosyltransferase family 2 protein [Vibrio kanaloae]